MDRMWRGIRVRACFCGWLAALSLAAASDALAQASSAAVGGPPLVARERLCEGLAQSMKAHWPDPSTHILSAVLLRLGPSNPLPGASLPGDGLMLPEHCDVVGVMRERTGVNGQRYAIHFHLRLPSDWNGRFVFQGSGGLGGAVGDALGATNADDPPALVLGFAVVSQDSGHDNRANTDPARGGGAAFGFDPQARADYGSVSLGAVADAALAAIAGYYGKGPPRYSYFFGCDKGGQEGLVFAQRYPERFNGILAGAPAISQPRAALAQAFHVQSLAALMRAPGRTEVPVGRLGAAFADADLALVRDAVLAACDADDGLKDGIVSDFARCTDEKVRPALAAKTCSGAKAANCLSRDQVQTLARMYAGPKDGAGGALYAAWPWDAGITGAGWRAWQLGSADGNAPAMNAVVGGAALAALFTTPPTAVPAEAQALADFQLHFDLARDAARIGATDPQFRKSAWDEFSARSSDLAQFQAHGGKLIVYHGVSDPVFSINDTRDWYQELQRRVDGKAAGFARLFPVPGMGHCGGGPATDSFGAFEALINWVEHGRAPDRLVAVAGPDTPWPGRSRPLCPFPKTAHYQGSGPVERARSFVCR